jgi:hypothetical protein
MILLGAGLAARDSGAGFSYDYAASTQDPMRSWCFIPCKTGSTPMAYKNATKEAPDKHQ